MLKKTYWIVTLFLIMGLGHAQTTFEEIRKEDVSQTELRKALHLAEKIMLGQKTGNYYMLSESEAIPEVARGLSKEVQAASYDAVKGMFGDYESLAFEEAYTMESGQGQFTIYRLKGKFSVTKDTPEIRVVMNTEGKVAGLWVRPWEDDLQGKP